VSRRVAGFIYLHSFTQYNSCTVSVTCSNCRYKSDLDLVDSIYASVADLLDRQRPDLA